MFNAKNILKAATIMAALLFMSCNNVLHDSLKNLGGKTIEPLLVVSTNPVNGATGIARNSKIEIEFNKDINQSTISEKNIVITDGTDGIAGNFSYADKVVTFAPGANLPSQSTIQVEVTTGLQGVAGNVLQQNHIISFSVEDYTPPQVSTSHPAKDQINVAKNSDIAITFDEDMDQSTINETTITLKQSGNPVSGSVSYANKMVTFDPDTNLTSLTTYTVTVSTEVKDIFGNALAAAYSYDFTSGDFVAPIVDSKSPADGAENVAIGANITVTFSEDMDSNTINNTSFTVNDGSQNISGSITYDAPNKTATFNPDADLEYGKTYTVTLSTGIKDSSGNSLSSQVQWSFQAQYPAQFGDGSDGDIVITSGAGTVSIRDLYENNTVTGVIVNGVSNKGLGHCDGCNGDGTTNYDPLNGRYIKAKNFLIENGAKLIGVTPAAASTIDGKHGVIWISVTGTLTNNGTLSVQGQGFQGRHGADIYRRGYNGYGDGGGIGGYHAENCTEGTMPGGSTYGSSLQDISNPFSLYGSAGGNDGAGREGSSGGGYIRIYAVNFDNNSTITASGQHAGLGGGGGSGGSIYIEAYTTIDIGSNKLISIGGNPGNQAYNDQGGSGAGHATQGVSVSGNCGTHGSSPPGAGGLGYISIKAPSGVSITGSTNPNYYDITKGEYHNP